MGALTVLAVKVGWRRLGSLCALLIAAGACVFMLQARSVAGQGVDPAASGRPAIWIDGPALARLKAKAAANDPDWVAHRDDADSYLGRTVLPYGRDSGSSNTTIGYAYQGEGWFSSIFSLALAYEISGNAAYANKVREILAVINIETKKGNLQPVAVDSGFPTRMLPLALGLAYAWCGDRLSASEKADTFDSINKWFDLYKTSPDFLDKDGPAFSNYFGGHLIGFGVAGLATAGENPRGREIADYMRARFNQINEAFTTGVFAGGYPLEGYTYGTNDFVRFLQYGSAVRTATGEDVLGGAIANKMVRNLIYNLKPNRWQFTDEADNPGDYTGVMDQTLPTMLTSLASGADAGYAAFFLQNFASRPPVSIPAGPAIRLIWGGTTPAVDYRTTLPLAFNSAGDEHLFTRSSWSDDAVWASFKASAAHLGSVGDTHGHDMRGAGHIEIQRGNDYLLVNSGQWKGRDGWGGNPQAFDGRSWRANTLFYQNPWGDTYRGAQGYWGVKKILAYEETPDYVYKKADLTSAYDLQGATSLRSFVRTFVSLGDGKFLLNDVINAANPTDTKTLYFHFNRNGNPQVAGNVVTSTVGDSRLFVKTMLPAQPVIKIAPDPVNDSDSTPITYRSEVSDSAASPDLTALHFFLATSRNVNELPDVGPISVPARNMYGAAVPGTTSKFVLFAVGGKIQDSVSYSVARGGLHMLFDMAPGKTMTVTIDGAPLASVKASRQGVIAFKAPSGGMVTVKAAEAKSASQAPHLDTQHAVPPASQSSAARARR